MKKRADGLYQVRRTINGVKRSFYGKTIREATEAAEQAKREHAQGLVLRANETVATYLTHWLAEVIAPPHRAWRTYVHRRGHIELHLIPALGSIRLDRLTAMDVRQALNATLRAGYAARTVNHIRSTLTAALNDALREGAVLRNVAVLVKPLPEAEDTRHPLTADETRHLLESLHGERLEALYVLGAVCGLRLGEATGLTWDAIDLTTGELRVVRALQWQTGGHVLKSPKNRASERTIVMPHAAREALRAHRRTQLREQEAVAEWGNRWNLVFTSRTGKPLHETTVNVLLGRYLAAADLPRQTYHMLRHACASLLAERGIPEIEVQALLGHASGKTTRRFYQHAYPSARQRVADTMDALLEGPRG